MAENMTVFPHTLTDIISGLKYQGPVVQNIVSLTSSLKGQLVKCFTTLL